jgi:hypothetical protein
MAIIIFVCFKKIQTKNLFNEYIGLYFWNKYNDGHSSINFIIQNSDAQFEFEIRYPKNGQTEFDHAMPALIINKNQHHQKISYGMAYKFFHQYRYLHFNFYFRFLINSNQPRSNFDLKDCIKHLELSKSAWIQEFKLIGRAFRYLQ